MTVVDPGGEATVPRVLLIGMPGSGKSSVAPLLSQRLGWGYLDTDSQIERVSHLSVAGYFARHGEEMFRSEESRVLMWVLGSSVPVVVAVGGGAILSPENRIVMGRGGIVVWLRATVDTLVARLGSGAGRPLLDGRDLRATLAQLDAQRRPLYQEIAKVVIDVDDGDADKATDRVLRALGRVGRWQST